MAKQNNKTGEEFFEKLAIGLTKFTGGTGAFIIALSAVIIWAATGPVFKYSEAWQLVINTGTTIVTFLMVFLIQRMQNKDSLAIHLKLNELIAAMRGASNRLIDAEDLKENELQILEKHYTKLAKLYQQHKDLGESHSIEEAERRHKQKLSNKR